MFKKSWSGKFASAAETLADLSVAIDGIEGQKLSTQQARRLNKANPILMLLTSALRKKGLLG